MIGAFKAGTVERTEVPYNLQGLSPQRRFAPLYEASRSLYRYKIPLVGPILTDLYIFQRT